MITRKTTLAVVLVVLFAFAGFLVPDWARFLLTLALAKGLAVLSAVLLMRAGLVSFGQALFYAASGYTVAFAFKYFAYREALSLLLLGILVSLVIATLIGLLLARYRAIFFAMLTLAFSMVLYGLLVKAYPVTSGTDGLPVRQVSLLGYMFSAETHGLFLYFLTLLVVAIALYLVYHFFHSPLGNIVHGVQTNEIRVEYLGVSVYRAIYLTYLLAGGLAGASGVLASFTTGHVEPNMAYWTTSGEFVIVAVLGGVGSVFAPVTAAVLFEFLRTYAYKYAPYSWQILLGALLLAIILFMPSGLWTLYDFVDRRIKKWRQLSSKRLT